MLNLSYWSNWQFFLIQKAAQNLSKHHVSWNNVIKYTSQIRFSLVKHHLYVPTGILIDDVQEMKKCISTTHSEQKVFSGSNCMHTLKRIHFDITRMVVLLLTPHSNVNRIYHCNESISSSRFWVLSKWITKIASAFRLSIKSGLAFVTKLANEINFLWPLINRTAPTTKRITITLFLSMKKRYKKWTVFSSPISNFLLYFSLSLSSSMNNE